MPRVPKTTIGVLKAARRLIEKGWIKGIGHKKVGPVDCYCAIGAISKVLGPYSWGRYAEATSALHADFAARRFPSLIDFNDSPRRTQSQVLALFDRTIARLEKEKAKAQ